jgi:uncharacterized protein YggE
MSAVMIEQPWGVTAFGAASVKAPPDVARLRFRISRTEPAPAAAFEKAGETVRKVREVLRRFRVPEGAVDASRLYLSSSWSYGNPRKFLGYTCSASFAMELAALDQVQDLLVAVVQAGANEIEGVQFDVVAKPRLRADARRQATAAARAKAELYADAAGVRLGPVVHIEDVDPERIGNQARGVGGAADGTGGDLAPGHVVVSAAVILGFAITAG